MNKSNRLIDNNTSLLDQAYRAATNSEKFFENGIGDQSYLDQLVYYLENIKGPQNINVEWDNSYNFFKTTITDGRFVSPVNHLLPSESRIVHIRKVMPANSDTNTPVLIHFAGTGDSGFKRRELLLAGPLARQGIGSIILEGPYYGLRKPFHQTSIYIKEASDLFKMVHATFEEGRSIVSYLENLGHRKIATTGFSMGGQISTMVGLNHGAVKAIIPCVTPHSPIPVFLEETLKDSIDWDALNKDLKHLGKCPKEFLKSYFHLSNMETFPRLHIPKSIQIIAAKNDAYVPNTSSKTLSKALGNAPLTWLDGGHVSAFLLHSDKIREKIKLAIKNI